MYDWLILNNTNIFKDCFILSFAAVKQTDPGDFMGVVIIADYDLFIYFLLKKQDKIFTNSIDLFCRRRKTSCYFYSLG